MGGNVFTDISEIPEKVDLAVIAVIESIDLNPVMCTADQCVGVDARIILKG